MPPSADKLIKEKLRRLKTVPEEFFGMVVNNQKNIFNDVLETLNKLELDSTGNLIMNNENFALIEILGDEMIEAIKKSGYKDSVVGFAKEFDKQKELNRTLFEETIPEFEDANVYDTIYKNAQKDAVGKLAETAVSENVQAYKTLLQDSISNSGNFTDLVKNLQTNIVGNSEIDGGLAKYAKQNASDLYSIGERNYTAAVSDSFGIEFFLFAGSSMDSSRCFCDDRKGKVFHLKEIQAWGRGENLGKCGVYIKSLGRYGWQGMMKGTNENTIFSYLGGYECQDSLIPKGIRDVPLKDIRRNIANGNIDPDDLPEDIQRRL
jgi:hypothetical protein